ncbi:hypothetical protein HZB60_05000 [candidate division KSB1 bacterium]|nr:hypothetical protein [candidate division KSB1 bacterium]
MKQGTSALVAIIIVLTLALAVDVRLAEGLTFFTQEEWTPTGVTPALEPNAQQIVLNLSGAWELRAEGEKQWSPGWIPGSYTDAQTVVSLRRSFTVPDSLRRWNLQIHIPEVHYSVEVWLNGRFISSFTGNHLGFSADLTRDHIKFGGPNELVLKLDNSLSPDGSLPVFPQLLQPLNYGGVFSGVFIRAVPSWSIEEVTLEESSSRDSMLVSGTVNIRIAQYSKAVSLADSSGAAAVVRAYVELRDSSGALIAESRGDAVSAGGSDRFQASLPLPGIRPAFWSPTAPVLYRLDAYLLADGDTLHRFSREVGFKRVRIVGPSIYLNGAPFTIRAVDYLPEAVRGRRAISEQQLRRDFAALKELNVNAIRLRYSAPSPLVVKLADETGFLLFAECGLDWIPANILSSPKFRQVLEHSYERLLTQFDDHVSVFAWSLGSNLDWTDDRTQSAVSGLKQLIRSRDSRPCFVECASAGSAAPDADIVLVQMGIDQARSDVIPPPDGTIPTIICNVGKRAALSNQSMSDASAGIVNQADLLIRTVLSIQERPDLAGFVIHSYADYHGASPLLAQPFASDPLIYTNGIVNFARQERIAYFKLRDLAQTGQVSPPIPSETSETPPMTFPAVGLAALLLLSVEMRRNNVFRQNLKRVFMHAHGFYSDLRYRRFLHTAQPLLLWLLESITLALLTSSLLYAMRHNLSFDFHLTHFLPWAGFKADLVALIWNPPRSVAYFTGFYLLLILLATVFVRVSSIPFREKVDLWQSANYIIWAYAALLFVLPLAVVFYRVLDMPQFFVPALLGAGAALCWCLFRLLTALRTGFGTTQGRITVTAVVAAVVVVGGIAWLLSNSRQTFAYLSFFRDMLGGS